MPVYNAEPYLALAVESILGQSYVDFELILLDDGSTDGSAAIMDRYARTDSRVRVIRAPHRGFVAALNDGLERARGRFIARMDADDIALPDRLSAQVEALQARPRLAVLGSHVEEIDQAGKPLGLSLSPVGPRAVAQVAESSSPVPHPAVLMRREPVESVGGYRPEIDPAQDYDLWLRILDAGFEIDNVPRVLLRYRMHPSSVSSTRRARQAACALMARAASRMRRDGMPDPVTPGMVVDADGLTRLPPAYRPCPAERWEALNGPVRKAGAPAAIEAVKAMAGGVQGGRCRRVTARFLLHAAVRLLILRRFTESWRALGRAHALDLLVVPRQTAASIAKKSPRAARRIGYSISARVGRR
jgi:glycosyltransferase involved in cell wall biosynthesis